VKWWWLSRKWDGYFRGRVLFLNNNYNGLNGNNNLNNNGRFVGIVKLNGWDNLLYEIFRKILISIQQPFPKRDKFHSFLFFLQILSQDYQLLCFFELILKIQQSIYFSFFNFIRIRDIYGSQ